MTTSTIAPAPKAVKARATDEQAAAFASLRALTASSRLRVVPDPEGFPIIPGRLGQIEWYCNGVDCWSCPLPGQVALAVWTDRPRLFKTLWAVPGVRRHQSGEREMRAVFPPEALEQVAKIIRARRRRSLTPEEARKRSGLPTVRATYRPPGSFRRGGAGSALPLAASRPAR